MARADLVGIDRERAARLVIALAQAAGALRDVAAQVDAATTAVGVCSDATGALRRMADWADGEKHDLEHRALLLDTPDGLFGPVLPSALVMAGPLLVPTWSSPFSRPPIEAGLGEGLDWVQTGIPKVSDPKIKDALDWLFHKAPPDAIGTGSTTDALWHEIQTGEPVKGHWHLQKALDALANLQKRMRNPNVAVADKDVARLAEADLEEALRSGPHPAADDLARTPSLRDALARYQPQALGEPLGVVEGVEATAAEMLGEGAHLGAEVIQDLEAAGEALGPLL